MTKIFRKLLQLQHTPTPQLQCNALLPLHPCRGWGLSQFPVRAHPGWAVGSPGSSGHGRHIPAPAFSSRAAQSLPPELGPPLLLQDTGVSRVPKGCQALSLTLLLFLNIWSTLEGRKVRKQQIYGQNQSRGSVQLWICHTVKVTHRDPTEPQTAGALHSWHSHCSPASSPEEAASQGQGPTGTAPAPLDTPWHTGNSAVLLLQRAEHQHPNSRSGRGIQG